MRLLLVLLVVLSTIYPSCAASKRRRIFPGNDVRSYLKLKSTGNEPLPTVLWHGMGDCCCNPLSMGAVKALIEKHVPGVYVHSLMLGGNVAADTVNGFEDNMNDQVALACRLIDADEKLKNGFNAVGFSQGGLFLRALLQRCPAAKIRNLVSVGGPQQGIYGLPYCPGDTVICNVVRKALETGAYWSFIQNKIVQAQYWHDPLDEAEYRASSIFLADINNENKVNATYKERLGSLQNFVLVQFLQDNMIVPKESAWFGFFAPGNISQVLKMEDTTLYKQDRLGLVGLKSSGRLHFLSVDADHLKIPEETLVKEIIEKYLV